MTTVDWVALGFVALVGLLGLRRGLVATAFSLAGIIVGAVLGARLAPHLLSGGSASPYAPVVALVGAVVLAGVVQAVASIAASVVRGGLRLTLLGPLDSLGGLVLGAAAGLAVVWVLGAVALHLPGQRELRVQAQRSEVLQRLNRVVSPRTLLNLLARVDPFPSILGPDAPSEPPVPEVLQDPEIRAAARSVVRVLGTSCGLGIEGSGWVAAPHLVVTAAHVVAGQKDTVVSPPGGGSLPAVAVAFDPRNDVAVLRVSGLVARPLAMADPRPRAPVAIVGYPQNGPLDAVPGRIGRTATVLADDADGHGTVSRTVTAVGGLVRHGNSGGPAIDSDGKVEATIFAARRASKSGYGVPASVVRGVLGNAHGPISTGHCAP